jgi:hypothetical protein
VYHDTFTYALQRIYECLEHPKFTAKMLLEAVQFVKNIKDGKENMDEDVSERINRMTVKGKNLEWMMGPTGDGLIHSLEFDITWERIEKLVGNKRLNKATREEVKKLIGAFLKKIGLRLGPALQNRGEL